MAYHDFTEMPVWVLANSIVSEVYILTEQLPKREDYALCGQLRRAAISIAANLAEAFGRGHNRDKINFYYYARGSAFEVRSHLHCGNTVGYFKQVEIRSISQKCSKVSEDINKIIKTLSS